MDDKAKLAVAQGILQGIQRSGMLVNADKTVGRNDILWIYAPTHREAVNLCAEHKIMAAVLWITDSTLIQLRGYERAVVVHCACVEIPPITREFFVSRFTTVLALRCTHDTHHR